MQTYYAVGVGSPPSTLQGGRQRLAGTVRLPTAYDPEAQRLLKVAADVVEKYRNTFRELAR